jgi:predicted DNA-binding transcriptional regulator AlpA
MEKKELLTARQASKLLAVSESTFYRWRTEGRFRTVEVKYGPHKTRYDKEKLIDIYNKGWEE